MIQLYATCDHGDCREKTLVWEEDGSESISMTLLRKKLRAAGWYVYPRCATYLKHLCPKCKKICYGDKKK